MPFISFIIPYYNLPLWMLCECLDSIQGLPLLAEEREIILIDDGSDVSVEHAIRQKGYELVYLHTEGRGPGGARNAGLEIARGKYIQFVDGDDCLIVGGYSHCLDIIRSQEPDMLLFDFSRTSRDICKGRTKAMQPMSGIEYMLHNNVRVAVWGSIVKRDTIGSLRFTDGIVHEDEEFTSRLILLVKRLCVTNGKAYWYRVREGSIMTGTNAKHIERRFADKLTVLLRLYAIAKSVHGDEREAMRRRVAQLTMGDIYDVIMLKKSYAALKERINVLSSNGLFPLPDGGYTWKYTWFRRLTNFPCGLRLLVLILPLLKRE